MIYNKENIDMSLVQCGYEEEQGYIYISDEYTNNILRLCGFLDISEVDFEMICHRGIFINKLETYAINSPSNGYYYARYILRGRFKLGEPIITRDAVYAYLYSNYVMNG